MPLHELIYVSNAASTFLDADIPGLLDQARTKNARLRITGVLVHHQDKFMQLLEGEREQVFALFATICRDSRHGNIINVWDHRIDERNFSDWSMAFSAPESLALRGKPGYSEFLEKGLAPTGDGSTGKRLLLRLRDDFLRLGTG